MAKRYLGGGVSFEQQDVYQEFSKDGGGGGGSSTLSGLTDVDISNPTDGQVLVYNAATGKWENGAGGSGVLVVHGAEGILDKTWQEIHDADIVILKEGETIGYLYEIISNAAGNVNPYAVRFFMVNPHGTTFDDPLLFSCSTASGYPQWDDQ